MKDTLDVLLKTVWLVVGLIIIISSVRQEFWS